MDPMHRAKQDYQKIVIPNDLDQLVDSSILNGKSLNNKKTWMNKGYKYALTMCIGLILVLSSSSLFNSKFFVDSASNETAIMDEETVIMYSLSEGEADRNTSGPDTYRIIDEHIEKLKNKSSESNSSSSPTQNTTESKNSNNTNYVIRFENDYLLSFIITDEEHNYYYTIDLNTDETITLHQLMGGNDIDYISLINNEVKKQVNKNEFPSITEKQSFYINEDGKIVIVFSSNEEYIMPFEIELHN